MNLWVNPHCTNAPVPQVGPGGAFYISNTPQQGTFVITGAVTNQPPGCPVWYQIEVEELSGANTGSHYDVVYMDREATTDLVAQGLPVPAGFVQFNPHPDDPVPQRARLGSTGANLVSIIYRVRAMNAIGLRSVWSDYKVTDNASCLALGFQCGGQ